MHSPQCGTAQRTEDKPTLWDLKGQKEYLEYQSVKVTFLFVVPKVRASLT